MSLDATRIATPFLDFLRKCRKYSLLTFSVVGYSTILSSLTILKMYALRAGAWDLGNYNQAMYSFVCCGKPFSWTADILNNPNGSLFGIHFSPIFFTFVPFYFLYPRPETLLVIQSFGIGIGAVPVFFLARKQLGTNNWGYFIAIAYLLNPLTLGLNWFDFHPEAFIPATILFSLYFFQEKQWLKLAISWTLALSTIEDIGLLLALLATYMIYSAAKKPPTQNYRVLIAPAILFLGAVASIPISILVIHSFNPENRILFGGVGSWGILGARGIWDIPSRAVADPSRAADALSYCFLTCGSVPSTKLGYLLLSFGPFAFASLLSPFALLPAAAWLAPALLSDNQAYFSVGLQYTAFVIPFMIYSAVRGFRRLKGSRIFWRMRTHRRFFVLLPILFLALSNPLLSLNIDSHWWAGYGVPSFGAAQASAIKMANMIPPSASVLANTRIFPLVSSRTNAYTIPWVIDNGTGSYFTYVYSLVNKVNYVMLDLVNGYDSSRNGLILSMTVGFGVLGYSNGIILLQRGYSSPPLIFDPVQRTFDYRQLALQNGLVINDNKSFSGRVLYNSGKNPISSDFWWGPYAQLPPGKYSVTYWVKTGPSCEGSLFSGRISAFRWMAEANLTGVPRVNYYYVNVYPVSTQQKTVFANANIICSMTNSSSYRPISMDVTLDSFGAYEFAGLNITANGPVYLDRITVNEISPLPSVQPFLVQYENNPAITFRSDVVSSFEQVIQTIPVDARVGVQDSLLALWQPQQQYYVLPSFLGGASSGISGFLGPRLDVLDYVLFQWTPNLQGPEKLSLADLCLSDPAISSNFGIAAWSDGIVLLKRGYSGRPEFFKPFSQTFGTGDLIPQNGTTLIQDPTAASGYALEQAPSNRTDFWWGPYAQLPPGKYIAEYYMKSGGTGTKALTLNVNEFLSNDTKIAIAKLQLNGQDLQSSQSYILFALPFIASLYGTYEFPGLNATASSPMFIDSIILTMQEPSFYFSPAP